MLWGGIWYVLEEGKRERVMRVERVRLEISYWYGGIWIVLKDR